jgi:ABC-type Fe3+-hydroxamate transport system substrate-binding protein
VTVNDADGTQLTLQQEPRRIEAGDDGMASTLRSLGIAADRIVVAEAAGPPQTGAALAVAWATSRRAGTGAGADRTYVAADQSINDVKQSLADLGLLLDRPLRARTLVDAISRDVRRVQQRVPAQRPKVFLDTGTFSTIASPGLVDDIIRTAGGRNVAGAATENQQPDPRELRRLDPDVYIATASSGVTLEKLRKDPRTRDLDAVRAGRFGIVPDAVLAPGPRVGEGVVAVARILHPDAPR